MQATRLHSPVPAFTGSAAAERLPTKHGPLPPHRGRLTVCLFSALLLALSAVVSHAQASGYIYVSDGAHSSVDVLRTADHVRIASMPTIQVPYGVAVTQDGKRVYVSTYDGKNIYTFDAETSTVVSTLQFGSELREIALTPDDKYLYVPDYNENVVHVMSTADNSLSGDIPVGANPHMVVFGSHGRYAYVTNEGSPSVTVIDTGTATVISTIPVGETPTGIAASPDGETIYVASYSDNEISFISTKTQSAVANVSVPGNATAVAASPDGKFIYAVCDNPAGGYAIAVSSQSIVASFPVGSQARNVIVSPDGKTIYETNFASQDLYAIDAATYELEYTKVLGGLDGIAFSESAKPLIEGYHFQRLDYPGAIETDVSQVNDRGDAVGWYLDQSQVNHGFFYHRGQFTSYDFPGSLGTRLLGINSAGDAVGYYTNSYGYIEGFRLRGGVATIIYVQVQSGGQTLTVYTNEVDGIDDEGSMVGVYYSPVDMNNHAFRLDGTSQQDFDYPGAPYTQASGVTPDLMSGWFVDSEGNAHAFTFRGDESSEFDFPGGGTAPDGSIGYTLAYKTNDRGDVAGLWGNAYSVNHGFLIETGGQKALSFDYPDAFSTTNYAVGDVGQVAGSWVDANGATHGFIATPIACPQ